MKYTSSSHHDVPPLILAVSKCSVDHSLYRDTCWHISCSTRPYLLLDLFRRSRLYGPGDGLTVLGRARPHATLFTTSPPTEENCSTTFTLPNVFSKKIACIAFALVSGDFFAARSRTAGAYVFNFRFHHLAGGVFACRCGRVAFSLRHVSFVQWLW